MKAPHYDTADIRRLKDFDILLAYCEKHLAPVKRRGHTATCTCPFGSHSRPGHLSITLKDGIGMAHCHACGGGGSVFDVAAAVLGVSIKVHFGEVARHIAETVGMTLREVARDGKQPRRSAWRNHVTQMAAQVAQTHTLPAPLEFLNEDDAAAALAAVQMAAARPDVLSTHAERLGIPAETLAAHTLTEGAFADSGLIGLAPDGRLLYVYTARDDAGQLRVPAVKLRSRDAGEKMALLRAGKWRLCGSMRYDDGKEKRFIFSAGRPACLYGIEAAKAASTIILTEGESDKLACEASFYALYTRYDGDGEQIPAEHMPAIVAKPCAGGFKAEHAALFRGKVVVVAADRDESGTGQKAAADTAELLSVEGVRVYTWTPPPGAGKDARAYYQHTAAAGNPLALAADIIKHKRPYSR